ncbi:5-formaminoimidazole-4-carboxamide-1-(Beta)-D-ribofuranosyl 5'-monophosphate synthetase [Candidatus Roizmanbacteria bacterium]|nr:5-formaminoimidazole-4-carboxamide-1-(Beta)-D-ribofuranosyl 5'-monophosphate synthetase [Candidatus Roizmanbacteria bacterium]
MNIKQILNSYNLSNLTIATLGSHSALDVCRGAKNLGFKTLVITEIGREKTYEKYYKTNGKLGCVDETITLSKFSDLLKPEIQKILIDKNSIFIPNRSFEAYLNFNYEAIENDFEVPMFGNRQLLKIEERGRAENQYYLLEKAGIKYSKQFKNPKEIDCLCLIKVQEKTRNFERAFFLAENYQDYKKQIDAKLKQGIFTEEQLGQAVIEEFIVGVQVNFNFFYSPIPDRLELLGTDMRRQTNIEGLLKIPSSYQTEVSKKISVKYEEAGHIAVTVLESMLEKAFELGERFVKTSQELFVPGIIGPFALQSIITAGPPKKDIVVIDISPRMPGSPGISSTPYSGYLYGEPVSVGQRVAMEIKEALKLKDFVKILT